MQDVNRVQVRMSPKESDLLRIVPINASGAEQRPCGWMVVAPVGLDVARKRRIHRDISRGYPVQDNAFYALRIIRPCIGNALLDLNEGD